MMTDIKKEVEAVLFASGRTVTVKELQLLLNVKDAGLIVEAIKELSAEYESRESPVMLVGEEDGFKLTVREKYLPVVHSINPHTELSKTILETLAVIAWKQPMLQSNVVKIRTNKAYDHISELERLGFITRERYGRSYLIKVTQKFLDYFDLPEPKAIKEMFRDFKDIEVAVKRKAEKMEEEIDKAIAEEGERDRENKDSPLPGEGSGTPETYGDSEADMDTYTDALPPLEHHRKESELETYAEPAPGVVDETPEDEELEEEKLEEAENALEKQEAEQEEDEASAAEKARRLAEELLKEDEPEHHEEEKSEDERLLHPELEDFISSEEEKQGGKASETGEGKSKDTERPPEETQGGDKERPEDEAEAPRGKDDEADEATEPAEEYPGQFTKGGE